MTRELGVVLGTGLRRLAMPAAGIGIVLLQGFMWTDPGMAAPIKPATERVSLAEGGDEANGFNFLAATSDDGRFVAFVSDATNLVAGDTNGQHDVFVRDRVSGTTQRVSVPQGGGEGSGPSFAPAISADGRFVAFVSDATNLVAGDTNGVTDVFVRDRVGGTTERVSIARGGAQSNGKSFSPAISADGRFVAFASDASNLVVGDTLGNRDVFVRDRVVGVTTRVSIPQGGGEGNQPSSEQVISGDGRYVAFVTLASNMVAGDTNDRPDVFVRDRVSGTTVRVSVAQGGGQGNGQSDEPAISADGRFVTFVSVATNLVAGGTFGSEIFVRDWVAGTTELASVPQGGGEANDGCEAPAISADGRYVTFESEATNLASGATASRAEIYLRDLATRTTEWLSFARSGGAATNSSQSPDISADGRFVAFESSASNLVSGDSNGEADIFVRDRATVTDVRLSVADVQGSEGTPFIANRSLTFTVRLSTSSRQNVSFRFWTEDVTAFNGTDYTRSVGTATIPAGSTSVLITVPLTADVTAEPNETLNLNIDVPINATISDGQGVGTIVNDDATITVGTFELTPGEATVKVGERLMYQLTWTVPSGSWRDLDAIEVRIGEGGSLFWLRFDEETRTLRLLDTETGEFGPAFAPGSQNVLGSGAARLDLADSSVIAAGPTSLEVTLLLSVEFGPPAIGRDYPVEVGASLDDGEFQDFDRGGTLTIEARHD